MAENLIQKIEEQLQFLHELEAQCHDDPKMMESIWFQRGMLFQKKMQLQYDESGDLDVEKLTEILKNCGINVVDLR